MTPESFVKEYENALSTHGWDAVDPLIHEAASVTFSDGTVHKGKAEVKKAFEGNFASIKNEKYSIADVHWVAKFEETAVFLFGFKWEGLVNGHYSGGSGCGTCVLARENGTWKLLVEHLGKKVT